MICKSIFLYFLFLITPVCILGQEVYPSDTVITLIISNSECSNENELTEWFCTWEDTCVVYKESTVFSGTIVRDTLFTGWNLESVSYVEDSILTSNVLTKYFLLHADFSLRFKEKSQSVKICIIQKPLNGFVSIDSETHLIVPVLEYKISKGNRNQIEISHNIYSIDMQNCMIVKSKTFSWW